MMPRGARYALAGSAALLFIALLRFVAARPVIETKFPRLVARPDATHNLALFQYGTVVRVSSANWGDRTHPGYAIDGTPGTVWASGPKDLHPWVEVAFQETHNVERAKLVSASGPSTLRVECWVGTQRIHDATVALAALSRESLIEGCVGVDRVRLSSPAAAGMMIGELEVWGR